MSSLARWDAEGLHFSAFHYLGIDCSSNVTWDIRIQKLLDNGRKRVNQLHQVLLSGM